MDHSRNRPRDYTLEDVLAVAQGYTTLKDLAEGLNLANSSAHHYWNFMGWLEKIKEALAGAYADAPEKSESRSPSVLAQAEDAAGAPQWAMDATEEEYGLSAPQPLASEEIDYYEDLVKYKNSEVSRLQGQVRKLRGQLNDREALKDSLMTEAHIAFSRKPTVRVYSDSSLRLESGWECHAPTSDIHVGRLSWHEDSFGADYDTEIACERIVDHGHEVAKFISGQPGRCRRVYLTDLGDIFNALVGHTEHGTPLPQDTRSTKVFRKTVEAQREKIEIVRHAADEVVVMGSQGNHDWVLAMMLWSTLHGYYLNDDTVDVKIQNTKQCYFTSGEDGQYTIHFLDHGTGINASFTPKAREGLDTALKAVVPKDVRAGALASIVYIGHLHHHAVLENNDVEYIRLPSMAEADNYETDLRLFSKPSAIMYRLNEVGYIDTSRRVYF